MALRPLYRSETGLATSAFFALYSSSQKVDWLVGHEGSPLLLHLKERLPRAGGGLSRLNQCFPKQQNPSN